MRDAALAWWRERSAREQRLLAAMFALIAIVLVWLAVARPLVAALEAAKLDHQDAVTALAETRARAAAADPPARAAQPAPLPLDAHLSRTADEAGFTGARVAARGPARASVAIEAARPQAFFRWVGEMEASGLAVESLTARANPDRTLAVEAAFRARTG